MVSMLLSTVVLAGCALVTPTPPAAGVAQPDAVAAPEAAFGPPSQAGFGSAVFYARLAPDSDLEQAALARYRFFVGDLWERYGADAWLGTWSQVYTRPPGAPREIVAELRPRQPGRGALGLGAAGGCRRAGTGAGGIGRGLRRPGRGRTGGLQARLYLSPGLFVQVSRNDRFDTTNLVLVHNDHRIFGRDQLGGNWHRHPVDDPGGHDFSEEGLRDVSRSKFLDEVEAILSELGLP